MTREQERDFAEQGFIVLKNFLTSEELARLSAAADEVVARMQKEQSLGAETHFQVRNALAQHDAFLDLVDHPRMLPLVVDAIGWNIQIRTTHLDYRPPYPRDVQPGVVGERTGGPIRRPATAMSCGIPTWLVPSFLQGLRSMGACPLWRSRSSMSSST